MKKECPYGITLPYSEPCCMVYSFAERPDHKWWAYWPKCTKENCPLENSDLLEGAVFNEEEFNKTIKRFIEKEKVGKHETLD